MKKLFSWIKQKLFKPHQEPGMPVRPFSFIHQTDPSILLNFIQQEHPQTIALILSYLEPGKASIILENLPDEVQGDIIRRIACMGRVKPEILFEVERVLKKKLPLLTNEDLTVSGGIDGAVDFLNFVDCSIGKKIIQDLEDTNPEIAETIKSALPKHSRLRK